MGSPRERGTRAQCESPVRGPLSMDTSSRTRSLILFFFGPHSNLARCEGLCATTKGCQWYSYCPDHLDPALPTWANFWECSGVAYSGKEEPLSVFGTKKNKCVLYSECYRSGKFRNLSFSPTYRTFPPTHAARPIAIPFMMGMISRMCLAAKPSPRPRPQPRPQPQPQSQPRLSTTTLNRHNHNRDSQPRPQFSTTGTTTTCLFAIVLL